MAEERIIHSLMSEKKISIVWLGIHDLYEEGDWVTLLDEPISKTGYDVWNSRVSNTPDSGGTAKSCGALEQSGMDDRPCSEMLQFVCEIHVS